MDSDKYPENELEDSLNRAFVGKRADSIIVDGDSLRSDFLRASLQLGLDKGWLYQDKDIEESQYTAVIYRLSNEGKSHFGV